jgi:phospholipid/cholesterol/gamma-HCH transport system substrate-binding protein
VNLFLSRRAKAGLLLFAVASAALGLFLSARFGGPAVHTSAPFTVTTALSDSQGVGPGSDVLLRGVRVGRVTRARADGPRTRLTLDLDAAGRRLARTDAVARIGAKTPLGEAFVDLDPGRAPGHVRDGGTIRSAPTVQIDEALEALDPGARRDLSAVLQDSARGLRSPKAGARLGATVDGLAQTTDQLDAVTRTLGGQAQDIAGTVRAGQAVVGALATRQASITALVRDARSTLAAAGSDPAALRAGLHELPALTREARVTLAQAEGLITDARGPVRDLRAAATPLAAALRAAPAPLDDLATVLQGAGALRAAATPALRSLERALPVLTPAVRALGPALANVVPMLDYLAPRTRTIAAWFSNTDALGRNGDAKGRWARFFIGIDPSSALGIPGAAAPRQNAYTPPGDAAANQPFKPGDFPRLQPYAPALAGTGPVPRQAKGLNP